MRVYRLITGDDDSEFCHRVTAALNNGWELHGGPAYAFDGANGVMRCAQAVAKDRPDLDYSPDLKLGSL